MPVDPLLYVLFIMATVGFIFTPGPIVSLVVSETMDNSYKNGIAVAAGAQAVSFVYLAINFFGFASVAALPDIVLTIIRYVGAAYLLFLAWSALKRKLKPVAEKQDHPHTGLAPIKSFRKSLLIASTSPKTILFFAAFFPQFINNDMPLSPQLAILSVTFLIVSFAMDMGWVFTAHKAREFLAQKDKLNIANQVSAGTLALGAILLLLINN